MGVIERYQEALKKSQPHKWKNPKYEKLYNNAVQRANLLNAEERYRKSNNGMLVQTALDVPRATRKVGGAVANMLGSAATRLAISTGELASDIGTGLYGHKVFADAYKRSRGSFFERLKKANEARDNYLSTEVWGRNNRRYYNTPFGKLGSFQKEALERSKGADTLGEELYAMANPMVDAILAGTDMAVVLKTPMKIAKTAKYAKNLKNANKALIKDTAELAKETNPKIIARKIGDEVKANDLAKITDEEGVRKYLMREIAIDGAEETAGVKLPKTQRQTMAAKIDKAIDEAKNTKEIEIKISKAVEDALEELDNTTTRTRLAREYENEMAQLEKTIKDEEGKAYINNLRQKNKDNLAEAIIKEIKSEPKTTKTKIPKETKAVQSANKNVKKQENALRAAINERDARKSIEAKKQWNRAKAIQSDAITNLKKAVKGKQTKKIKVVLREEKPVKTTQRALLKKKLREQSRNMKAGAKFGRDEVVTYNKALKEYAKKSDLTKDQLSRLAKQKQYVVKNKKQFDKAIAKIETLAEEAKHQRTLQKKKDIALEGLETIKKDIKKIHSGKQGNAKYMAIPKEFNNVLGDMYTTAKTTALAGDFDNAKKAIREYESAVDKVKGVALAVRSVNKKVGQSTNVLVKKGFTKKEAKSIINKLMGRLEMKYGSDAFRDALLSGKLYDKKAQELLKVAKLFRRTDKLIPEKDALALIKIFGLDSKVMYYPSRIVFEGTDGYKALRELSSEYTMWRRVFGSAVAMKKKNRMIEKLVSDVQIKALTHNKRKQTFNNKFNNIRKAFKKGLNKKEYKESTENMFKFLNGESVELTEREAKAVKPIKEYFDYAKNYLMKNDPTFVGRGDYVPHIEKTYGLRELIDKKGLTRGIEDYFKSLDDKADAIDVMKEMYDVIGKPDSFFLKTRRGEIKDLETDVFKLAQIYANQFESLKYYTEINPTLNIMRSLAESNEINAGAATWLNNFVTAVNKTHKSNLERVIDKITAAYYAKSLGFSPMSTLSNTVGGQAMNMIENGIIKTNKGMTLYTKNPVAYTRFMQENGLLGNTIVDFASEGFDSSKIMDGLMMNQTFAENFIRGSMFVGELTGKERKLLQAGKLKFSQERILEMAEKLDKTQLLFMPEFSSQLYNQKALKIFTPFTRWMTASTRITKDAIKDVTLGLKHGDFSRLKRGFGVLGREAAILGTGLYIRDRLSKKPAMEEHKIQKKIADTLVDTVRAPLLFPFAFMDMPMLEDVQKVFNSAQILGYKLGVRDKPYDMDNMKTIKDIYVAPLGGPIKKLFGEKSYIQEYKDFRKLPKSEQDRLLKNMENIGDDKGIKMLKKYQNMDKLGITNAELEIYYIYDYAQRAKAVNKYLQTVPNKKATLHKLVKAKIITKEVLKEMKKLGN